MCSKNGTCTDSTQTNTGDARQQCFSMAVVQFAFCSHVFNSVETHRCHMITPTVFGVERYRYPSEFPDPDAAVQQRKGVLPCVSVC